MGRRHRVKQLMLWPGFEPDRRGQRRGPTLDGVEYPDPGEEIVVGLGCDVVGSVGLTGGYHPQDYRVRGWRWCCGGVGGELDHQDLGTPDQHPLLRKVTVDDAGEVVVELEVQGDGADVM